MPAGLASMVAVASLAVALPAAAPLAAPLVVGLAAAGLVLARAPWRRLDLAATAAAAVVFVLAGAPVLLSGEPTFAGYIKLDDTATFLALADRVLDHGRDLGGLAPSTYEATLEVNLAHGYPVGAVLPLGIVGKLLGAELAWLYQPWLAFGAAALALALSELVRPLVRDRRLAAAVAAVGALSALLYGFALWGGVKELAVAPLLVLVAVLAARVGREAGFRSLLPLAVACAALLDTLSLGGAVWLAPLLLPLLPLACRSPRAVGGSDRVRGAARERRDRRRGGVPARVEPRLARRAATSSGISSARSRRGSSPASGSAETSASTRTRAPSPACSSRSASPASRLAVAMCVRQRLWSLLLAVAGVVAGALVFVVAGSPWVGAKALAVASPVVLAVGLAGHRRGGSGCGAPRGHRLDGRRSRPARSRRSRSPRACSGRTRSPIARHGSRPPRSSASSSRSAPASPGRGPR